jgi:aminocarboxymuconate-semialdehyde decarboxylase
MIIDFEHHYTPYEIWKKRGGKPGEIVRMFSSDGREIRPLDDASHDIQLHLKNMDIAGIDTAVLTGTVDNLEEAKLFNDECTKVVKAYPKRFVGFASTMPLEGKPAFDELARAKESLGLRGVMISAQVNGHFLDSRELWPFYEKVSELQLPIFVHVSLAAEGFDACKAPYDLNRTLVREFDLILATTRVCLGGVLENFPNLKFIMAHFGGGISSIKERLDRYVSYWGTRFWSEKPLIREPYAERFNEHFNKIYFNMAGREIGMETITCALTNISPRRLLFATDYPPNFVDDPMGMKRYIEEIKKLGIDKRSIEAMLGTNAIELLGL